jgi:hypothetical protein
MHEMLYQPKNRMVYLQTNSMRSKTLIKITGKGLKDLKSRSRWREYTGNFLGHLIDRRIYEEKLLAMNLLV